MTSYSFRLPDLGEGTVDSEIVAWHARVGDEIRAEQPLVDMMTDKATIEITAPVSGKLVAVAGKAGDVIAVGDELAVFASGAENALQEAGSAIDEMVAAETSPHRPAAVGQPGSTAAQTSPAIRRLAREHGIDLNRVRGTGPNGRIIRADIDTYLIQTDKSGPDEREPEETGKHEIKLQGVRRKIAERMSLSASRIPHFSYVEEVDVTELERLRQHLNATRRDNQTKLTYLSFFMHALVKVVKQFPRCNAHFDDERHVVTQFDPVHIGIAVQTDNGLLVPVIRHVETLDLWQCAHKLRQIVEKARTGQVRREELSGSTITITSLGALGGIVSTPIINYPEVAIIGINRTQQRQVFDNNGPASRLMMNISSSFDHRIIDGYDAACAVRSLKSYLEFPALLFMEKFDSRQSPR